MATMKVIIKNGVTIIKTGDANGGVKNKHEQSGVSMYYQPNGAVKYRAEIQTMRKKHYLGIRDTVEEAVALRQEAEKQIANGTFAEWVKHIKHPTAKSKYKKIGISQSRLAGGRIKYMVQFKYEGERHYLGKFDTLQEAYDILDEAEKQVENGTFETWYEEYKNTRNSRGKN